MWYALFLILVENGGQFRTDNIPLAGLEVGFGSEEVAPHHFLHVDVLQSIELLITVLEARRIILDEIELMVRNLVRFQTRWHHAHGRSKSRGSIVTFIVYHPLMSS